VADGAPGLWKAVAEAWPAAPRPALHRAQAQKPAREAARAPAARSRSATGRPSTSAAPAKAKLQALAAEYAAAYPSFARSLEQDLDALVVHLRFPHEHHKRIRSTNLLERTFVEVRRRTKVIGRIPGETSALALIWAVLELASRGWRGVTMTPRAVAQIERLRRALAAGEQLPETHLDEEVIAA